MFDVQYNYMMDVLFIFSHVVGTGCSECTGVQAAKSAVTDHRQQDEE